MSTLMLSSKREIDLSNVTAFHLPEFKILSDIFWRYGYEIRVAGGAVRDVLMSKDPKDVDLATTATPDQMIEMFTKENIRMLNRNGEAHGTVTVRINDKTNYEVTTLRIDVNHDGRHAEVAFTTDWKLDASRRDLTVNSMFLSVHRDVAPSGKLSGTLYDYFNGFEDLSKRHIRFVGDPAERINEDYLRILRYFRFHGRLCLDPEQHDKETLKAISDNCQGLKGVAGERIWMELKQIMLYPSAPSLLRCMASSGVTRLCGLPEELNWSEIKTVWDRGIVSLNPNPATCVAATLFSQKNVEEFVSRVHSSNFESSLLEFLVGWRDRSEDINDGNLLDYFKHQFLVSTESNRLKPLFEEAMRYIGRQDLLEIWLVWQPPRFPINGHLVEKTWQVKGRLMRPVLQELKEIWFASGCQITAEELLADSNREHLLIKCRDTITPPEDCDRLPSTKRRRP